MAKARFVYKGKDRSVESVVRKSKAGGGLYDSYLSGDIPMIKIKEGEACIRILPPTWTDVEKYGDGWEIGIYLHYNVGPDNGAYLCLNKMTNEACPVCEARRDAVDGDEADKLKPSYRVLAWAVDRDNEKAGPQVWSLPVTLFKDIMARSIDKKTNTPILIDDPEEGYDIIFNRAGTDLRTKYTAVEVSREPSPLHDDQKKQDAWLEYITENPLPDILQFFEAAQIEKVLFGKAQRPARDTDDETVSERPSRSRRSAEPDPEEEPETPRRGRRSEPEPEPEDDAPPSRSERRRALLSEETDPEPEPETPRRGARRTEPEPEPEEEPETPRNRRRGAAEEPAPVARARASLERLKPQTRSGRGR